MHVNGGCIKKHTTLLSRVNLFSVTLRTTERETPLLVPVKYVCHKCFSHPKNSRLPTTCDIACQVHLRNNVKEAVVYCGCASYWLIHFDMDWMSDHCKTSRILGDSFTAVPAKIDTFHFRPATIKPAPKRVKFTFKMGTTLSPIIKIVKDDSIPEQGNLQTLKSYPN